MDISEIFEDSCDIENELFVKVANASSGRCLDAFDRGHKHANDIAEHTALSHYGTALGLDNINPRLGS